MDSKKKMLAISICIVLVIVAVILAIGTGNQSKGSVNTIEVPGTQSETPNQSALPQYKKGLDALVKAGYLDSATQDAVLAAVQKYESDPGTKAVGTGLSVNMLKESGLISAAVAEKVIAAIDKQNLARKEEKFRPLVSTGAFADTASAEKAYNSYVKQITAKTSPLQEAVKKEIESAQPPMTDAEKKQKQDAFEAGQPQRIDELLAAMVSANEINKPQADALKAFVTK